jgi:hypothetical protein
VDELHGAVPEFRKPEGFSHEEAEDRFLKQRPGGVGLSPVFAGEGRRRISQGRGARAAGERLRRGVESACEQDQRQG